MFGDLSLKRFLSLWLSSFVLALVRTSGQKFPPLFFSCSTLQTVCGRAHLTLPLPYSRPRPPLLSFSNLPTFLPLLVVSPSLHRGCRALPVLHGCGKEGGGGPTLLRPGTEPDALLIWRPTDLVYPKPKLGIMPLAGTMIVKQGKRARQWFSRFFIDFSRRTAGC